MRERERCKVYLIVNIVNGDIVTSHGLLLCHERVEKRPTVCTTSVTHTVGINRLKVSGKFSPLQIQLSPWHQSCAKPLK